MSSDGSAFFAIVLGRCVVAAQMYEKLVKQGTAKFIIGAYVAMMVLVALLALIAISSEPMNVTLYNVAVWLGWLAPASHDGRAYVFACLEM